MAVSRLAALAARAPVPVFAALGGGAADRVRTLLADAEVELVASPRHATVLLVAGTVPAARHRSLAVVHDQLPEPRATVWWGADPHRTADLPLPDVVAVAAHDDPVAALHRVHARLVTGDRPSAPTVLPATSPVVWQGVGPYGTGGEGMMGGTPYGRPMAMTGPDRTDGLALDRLEVTVGPFLAGFPPGLVLDVVLQGDVLQEVTLADAHDPAPTDGGTGGRLGDPYAPFRRALTEPVALRDLELARARHELGVVASLLWLHGLPALARRVARLASDPSPQDAAAVAGLHRRLVRTRALAGATAGVGRLAPERFGGASAGVLARAAGIVADARGDDPVYQRLGFEPHVRRGGDAQARWRQRLGEAAASLHLAADAGGATTTPSGVVEGLHGRLTLDGDVRAAVVEQLPASLVGLEWGDAVTTIASLGLDDAPLGAPIGAGS